MPKILKLYQPTDPVVILEISYPELRTLGVTRRRSEGEIVVNEVSLLEKLDKFISLHDDDKKTLK